MSDKREFLARYGSAKHIDDLLADKTFHEKELVLKNPMATPEHHEKLYRGDGPTHIKTASVISKGFPSYLRHEAMTHENSQIRMTFARRPDITDEEFQHLKHDHHPDVIKRLADWRFRPMAQEPLTNSRISDIIHNGPNSARQVVSQQRDLPMEHVDDILKTNDTASIANVARYNVNLSPSHEKFLSEHPEKSVRGHLAMNIATSDETRSKLESDPDEAVRMFATSFKSKAYR